MVGQATLCISVASLLSCRFLGPERIIYHADHIGGLMSAQFDLVAQGCSADGMRWDTDVETGCALAVYVGRK